jgi:hypothetical protein
MKETRSVWSELFCDTLGEPFWIREVRRRGEPFLGLPLDATAALETLTLFSSHTFTARASKRLLEYWIRAHLPLPLRKHSLRIDSELLRFIKDASSESNLRDPGIGVWVGNGRPAVRRFILLLFSSSRKPLHVMKVAAGIDGRRLVADEHRFLSETPHRLGMPHVIGSFSSSRLEAFAMDYVPGHAPEAGDRTQLLKILSAWSNPTDHISVQAIPAIERLATIADGGSVWKACLSRLAGRSVCTVVFHGDFAPWNIKARSDGTWTVLDWERGETRGVPCWDWFHFVIQPELLARQSSLDRLIDVTENLLRDGAFASYCTAAGATGIERELFLTYLLYMVRVIKPDKGSPATRDLLLALSRRWERA